MKKESTKKFSFNVTAKNNAVITRADNTTKYVSNVKNSAIFFNSEEYNELKKARVTVYKDSNGVTRCLFVKGFNSGIITIMLVDGQQNISKVFTTVDISATDKLYKTNVKLLQSVCIAVNKMLADSVYKFNDDSRSLIDWVNDRAFTKSRVITELNKKQAQQYAMANANRVIIC